MGPNLAIWPLTSVTGPRLDSLPRAAHFVPILCSFFAHSLLTIYPEICPLFNNYVPPNPTANWTTTKSET